ncbi:B12-binding domain-containing radical SAM protein [candidate division CSSED10-310 bacterium]|uniref:B12-binding domain-containing radical SAM protein n=1 Tax=candidate division CSSED10-310 bacterium TaxID=2855610 RepID=A0ABV6YSS2_UNCC1
MIKEASELKRKKIRKVLITNPASKIKITKEGRVIMPLNISFETPRMPLSMALMAGGLESQVEVCVIDAVNEELNREQLNKRIAAYQPDLTIINCSTPSIYEDMAIAGAARAKGSLTAVFGQHADAIPHEVMESHQEIDFCFIQEPEVVAGNFVRAWNENKPLQAVPGLAFRQPDNGIMVNDRHPSVSLEDFPKPARHLLKNELYRLPDGDLYTLVLASRGCPYNCPFCIAPPFHGSKLRLREPTSLVAEVEDVYHTMGIKSFLFQADLFTAHKQWVMEICELILAKKLKIRWICNSRVDTVDEEMLRMMRRAGCFLMAVGIESGSPQMLTILGKKPDLQKIKWMVNTCHKVGIKTNGSFVIGYPGETEETLAETEALVMQLPLDFAVFLTATPFPGTLFYQDVTRPDSPYTVHKEWNKFCYVDYTLQGGLPEETVKQFSDRMLRKYFLSFHYLKLRLSDLKHPVSFAKTIWYASKRFPHLIKAFRNR